MRTGLAVGLFLALAVPASAAPGDLSWEFRFGIAGSAGGGWTPVAVAIENPAGGTTAEIDFAATVHAYRGAARSAHVRFTLEPGARQVRSLYLHLDSGEGGVEVSLKRDGRELLDERSDRILNANPLHDDFHVLAVTREAGAFGAAGRADPPTAFAAGGYRGPSPVRLGEIHLQDVRWLPERAQAYDPVGVLILHDVRYADLRPAQARAIADWTARGGFLVLVPGGDPGWFREDWIRELSGVVADGAGREVVSPKGLETLGGGVSLPERPFRLHGIRAADEGTRPLYPVGTELVFSRSYGLGTVVTLAFDAGGDPVRAWGGAHAFWTTLWRGHTPVRRDGSERDRYYSGYGGVAERRVDLNPAVCAAMRISRLPSLALVTALLVGYLLAVGPANFFLLWRRGRTTWVVFTIPAIALLFAGFTFGVGMLTKGITTVTRDVVLIDPLPGIDRWHTRTFTAVYTVDAGMVEVADARPDADILSIDADEGSLDRAEVRWEQGAGFAASVYAPRWSMRYFRIEGFLPAEGAVRREGTRIVNTTPYPAVIHRVERGRVRTVGEVAPGGTLSFEGIEGFDLRREGVPIPHDADRRAFPMTALAVVEAVGRQEGSGTIWLAQIEGVEPTVSVDGASPGGDDRIVFYRIPELR